MNILKFILSGAGSVYISIYSTSHLWNVEIFKVEAEVLLWKFTKKFRRFLTLTLGSCCGINFRGEFFQQKGAQGVSVLTINDRHHCTYVSHR